MINGRKFSIVRYLNEACFDGNASGKFEFNSGFSVQEIRLSGVSPRKITQILAGNRLMISLDRLLTSPYIPAFLVLAIRSISEDLFIQYDE